MPSEGRALMNPNYLTLNSPLTSLVATLYTRTPRDLIMFKGTTENLYLMSLMLVLIKFQPHPRWQRNAFYSQCPLTHSYYAENQVHDNRLNSFVC
jgi:hypothetical protein